jgi:two-component system, LuxR family, response regulator FixJ
MPADQTVFLIEDEEAVRDSMKMMLERAGYDVRAFASAEEFLEAYDASASGCIVCDVRLGGQSGLDLQRELNRRRCPLPVILITGHGDVEMAVAAVKRGAIDFIEKPFDDGRLYTSVSQALVAGREFLAKEEEISALRNRIAELSPRQRDVLELLIDGLSSKEIGKQLGISPRTVETYRAFVMAKMGASSLAELVKMSIRAGLRA